MPDTKDLLANHPPESDVADLIQKMNEDKSAVPTLFGLQSATILEACFCVPPEEFQSRWRTVSHC